jgi:hypothetical protein
MLEIMGRVQKRWAVSLRLAFFGALMKPLAIFSVKINDRRRITCCQRWFYLHPSAFGIYLPPSPPSRRVDDAPCAVRFQGYSRQAHRYVTVGLKTTNKHRENERLC